MSTHRPAGRPTGEEEPPHSGDHQAGRLRTALSPSPSDYSVEVSFPRSPWLDFHFRSPLKAPPAPPAVPARRVPGNGASELEGNRGIVSVPMSFGRSAELIWKFADPGNDILRAVAAVVLVGLAWCVALCWYLIWCILLVPYRVIVGPHTKTS